MRATKRILLIGLGRWGANHLRILKSMPVDLFVTDLDAKALGAAEIPEDHCGVDARALFAKTDAAVAVTPVRNKLSGENITDAGCTYRVFKRECIANVKFFKGAHRFLPTLIKMEGFNVAELPVSAHPRFSGASHYGVWNRLFKSFRDLMGVRWMKSRKIRYELAESSGVISLDSTAERAQSRIS